MDVQKIIQSVTKEQVQEAQETVKAHFELVLSQNGQMNMIAFD